MYPAPSATPAQGCYCPAAGAHPGAQGLCPGWGTQLLLSTLQVQPVAKLSTDPRDTEETDMAVCTGCHKQGIAFNGT